MARTPSNEETTTCDRQGNTPPVRPRPTRVQLPAQHGDAIEQARSALRAANRGPDIFRKGSAIVQVTREQLAMGETAFVVRELTARLLRGELAQRIDWFDEEAHPLPVRRLGELAADLAATPDQKLPYLDRIVTSPVYTRDGNLILTPGYDPASGILYEPPPDLRLPTVPARPTKSDVRAAVKSLKEETLGDFPFPDAASLANVIAALLVNPTRTLIDGPVPLHAATSPTPGSGKGVLWDVVALIVTGSRCAPVSLTFGGQFAASEASRVLTAILLQCPEIALVDNVRDTIDSAPLAALLTGTEWQGRKMGTSDMRRLPNRTLWLVTGNQLRFSPEISRRTALSRIEPDVEKPWQRSGFRHPDLRRWVGEHRGDLLRAVLILVQAWIAQGRPRGLRVRGSFEAWCEVIGGILDVAGIEGFLCDEEEHVVVDIEGRELRELVKAWHSLHSEEWIGASEILNALSVADLSPSGIRGDTTRARLASVGAYLARMKGRVADGLRILNRRDEHQGANRYRLQAVQK